MTSSDNRGFQPFAVGASFILGAFLGWGVLRAGIAGVIGLIALLFLSGRGDRGWERLGACLVGSGVVGTVAFAHVMIGSHPCVAQADNCYAVGTVPALFVSAGVAAVGLVLLIAAALPARGRRATHSH